MLPYLGVILWALTQFGSSPTQLRIVPVDESGQMLRLSRADVYLDVWGGGKHVPLAQDVRGVTIRLDRGWLCTAWREICGDHYLEGRLILEATGYVPVSSASFLWLGGVQSPVASPVSSVRLDLGSGRTIRVAEGQSRQVTVRFRRPSQRLLRVVNDAGIGLANVMVTVSMLLATSNHCGGVEGDVLLTGETGPTGELVIPDADVEYAFEFRKAHFVLATPSRPEFPMRLIGRMAARVSTVPMRPLTRRGLRLLVTGEGQPLADIALHGCVADCPCGACCGRLATTDTLGRIDIEDFYPDEFDRIMLIDSSGRQLWEGETRQLPKTGWVTLPVPKR